LIDALFAEPALVFMLGALMIAGGLVIIGGHPSRRGPLAVMISLLGGSPPSSTSPDCC
jgi:hypothetical protein